jgi:hypothetical protein
MSLGISNIVSQCNITNVITVQIVSRSIFMTSSGGTGR